MTALADSAPASLDAPPAPRRRSPAVALAVLTAGVATVGAQGFALAPLLPDVTADLATGPAAVGRAVGAYGAGVAVAALALGPRLDDRPRRTVLTLGMLLVTAALLGSSAAPTPGALVVAQLLAGAGAGVVLPATYALAGELAAPGAEARATGRVLLGWSAALVAGVPLSSLLGELVGWRGALLGLAGCCLAATLLYRLLPGGRPAAAEAGAPRRPRYAVALRTPGVPSLLVGVLAFMTAFYAVYSFLGDAVRAAQGGGSASAGLVALAYGVGFGLASAGDRLLDRLGPSRVLAPTFAVLGGVYLLLPAVVGSRPGLLAAAVLWGVVNHVGLTILVARLTHAAPHARAAAMALYTGATYAAATVAGVVGGLLYAEVGLPALGALAAVVVLGAAVVSRRADRAGHGRAAAGEALAAPVGPTA